MKNPKNTATTSSKDLPARAEATVATLAKVSASAEAAQAAWVEARSRIARRPAEATPEDRLQVIAAEIHALEAEDDVRAATVVASAAFDAAEVDENDELALSRDPVVLLQDLTVLAETADRIRAQLVEAETRLFTRQAAAHAATAKLTDRRSANGLPPPLPLPRNVTEFYGTDAGPVAMITTLQKYLESGELPPSRTHGERLARLRADEHGTRVNLEREHRDAMARAAEKAEQVAAREQADERRRQVERAEQAAQAAVLAAEMQEDQELAAAHRARTA